WSSVCGAGQVPVAILSRIGPTHRSLILQAPLAHCLPTVPFLDQRKKTAVFLHVTRAVTCRVGVGDTGPWRSCKGSKVWRHVTPGICRGNAAQAQTPSVFSPSGRAAYGGVRGLIVTSGPLPLVGDGVGRRILELRCDPLKMTAACAAPSGS